MEGVNFAGTAFAYLATDKGKAGRRDFCTVVNAFRNVLLGGQAEAYTDLSFEGRRLADIASTSVPSSLRRTLRIARRV